MDIRKYIWTHFLDNIDCYVVRVALRVRCIHMGRRRVLLHCLRHDYQSLFWHFYDSSPHVEDEMWRESLYLMKDLSWYWDKMYFPRFVISQHTFAHALYYSAWLIRNGANAKPIQQCIAEDFRFLNRDHQALALKLGIFNGYDKDIVM